MAKQFQDNNNLHVLNIYIIRFDNYLPDVEEQIAKF